MAIEDLDSLESIVETPVEKEEELKDTPILIDGPLSEVYTKALRSAFARTEDTRKTILDIANENYTPVSSNVLHYVYVLSRATKVPDDEIIQANSKLNLALDELGSSKVTIKLEGSGSVTGSMGTLLDGLLERGITVTGSDNVVRERIAKSRG